MVVEHDGTLFAIDRGSPDIEVEAILRWDERAAESSGRLKWQSFHREGTA
jgi:hypothetical protein